LRQQKRRRVRFKLRLRDSDIVSLGAQFVLADRAGIVHAFEAG